MLATLESQQDSENFESVSVPTTTVDLVVRESEAPIGLMKIDIENHELQAFKGAEESFLKKKIRDILYEDHRGVGSEASKYLIDHGFVIFGMHCTVFGPVLVEDLKPMTPKAGEHNLVATLDPERVKKRIAKRGYACLSHAARTKFCND